MTITPDELHAGQDAYQRVKSYQRNNSPFSSYLFLAVFLGMPILRAVQSGQFGMLAVWIAVIALSAWQLHWQKLKNQKNLAYLAELKAKYGPDVYTDLKKEPSTISYKLFQKVYSPFGSNKEPVLP